MLTTKHNIKMQIKDLMVKNRCLLFFLIFLAITKKGISQIFPKEGSKLNYVLTKFSVPGEAGVKQYEFRIAKGTQMNEKEFNSNIIFTLKDTSNRTVVKLPEYGSSYTWQVGYKKGKKSYNSKLYHFSTDTSSIVDTQKYRIRVLSNNYTDSTLLFFLDYAKALYDVNGMPVWFLPDVDSVVSKNIQIRDLKMTEDSTITFLSNDAAYEIDYKGNVLWRKEGSEILKEHGIKIGRDNRSLIREQCHHEFTKLRNGNYMLMSGENVLLKMPYADSVMAMTYGTVKTNDGYYRNTEFGILAEYDAEGKLVWEWKASEYFADKVLFTPESEKSGLYYGTTHMNAFHFNEEDSVIYIGFRDVSSIVKIKYPEGNQLAHYGDFSNSGNLFAVQHSCALNKAGNLYVFNNNAQSESQEEGEASSIVIFREIGIGKLRKLWEFNCDIDKETPAIGLRGGNVVELDNGDMICCMGTSPRLFIVGKGKEVLFNAISEQWNAQEKKWVAFPQYRVNPVSNYSMQLKN